MSERLIPRGWERINPDNQPTLVHPDRRHCVVVASGTGATGRHYAAPTTKNPKGRTIQAAVQSNAALALLALHDVAPELASLRETWMLLTFVNIDGQIQSEVSLPNAMEGEQISSWRDRILIPTLDPSVGPDHANEEPPDYDFDIVRK
ncbi:hypothetical protein [Kibdelosporangium aridum]|uniref:hypothetical protein n=1 Tax=Kibdelosporangium aridum TaxID=2030 RepID=UPI00190E9240|nr:hypothetical protein [Kibdelosporangium aridum]